HRCRSCRRSYPNGSRRSGKYRKQLPKESKPQPLSQASIGGSGKHSQAWPKRLFSLSLPSHRHSHRSTSIQTLLRDRCRTWTPMVSSIWTRTIRSTSRCLRSKLTHSFSRSRRPNKTSCLFTVSQNSMRQMSRLQCSRAKRRLKYNHKCWLRLRLSPNFSSSSHSSLHSRSLSELDMAV
ncbi:hypothetical protein OXX59_010141, partial [Metschnikowia pulcherrima]